MYKINDILKITTHLMVILDSSQYKYPSENNV